MPDNTPDLLLLFCAGLLLVLLASLGRGSRGGGGQGLFGRRDQAGHNPARSNSAPSTGRGSIPSQPNMSA